MILYDTEYLQLKSTTSKTGNDWVYAHRPNVKDVVVILPLINNQDVLFLIEERPPLTAEHVAQYCIGLPAGLVGDVRKDENIEDAIKAELLEEAGLIADKIEIKTRKLASSAGCTSEVITVAIAYIDEYKVISAPVDDGGIIVSREIVKIDNIKKWLKKKESEGYAISASTFAALYYIE